MHLTSALAFFYFALAAPCLSFFMMIALGFSFFTAQGLDLLFPEAGAQASGGIFSRDFSLFFGGLIPC